MTGYKKESCKKMSGENGYKKQIRNQRGTPALHLNEPADGKLMCCWLWFGFVLLLYLYDIRLFEPKQNDQFWIFEGPRLCRIQK